MKTRLIETEKAIGQVICHDITRIEKGVFKGACFKKGHLIQAEDVDTLLSLGKKHIYALELEEGEIHEDEAGLRLGRALAGEGLELSGPSEGRLDLAAKYQGLLKVDISRLQRLNTLGEVTVATLHNNSPVEHGEKVCGTRVIPLAVAEKAVFEAEEICRENSSPLKILPYRQMKIGAIITGREIMEARVDDGFQSVLAEKTALYGQEKASTYYSGDDAEEIVSYIYKLLDDKCDMIIITGGMSVDPDDRTPEAIKKSGAKIVKYGAPVLPGAMFLLAYHRQVPVVGLPACAMYFQNTVLDLLLPRLLAGEKVTASEIAALGHGGLCRRCDSCRFPACSFGKNGTGR